MDKYGFKKKIIAYVKDEESNLNVMIITLKAVVNYEPFGLENNFQGICFGHVFSKACQYGTEEEKVCKDLKYVYIKSIQAYLRNLEREGKNGTRFVLKLAFTPKI